jgi:hypothetical protein
MKRIRTFLKPAALLAACLIIAFPSYSLAQGEPARLALVLGNSHYEGGTWVPLRNPANDAIAISKALRALRFEIVGCGSDTGACLDATLPKMDSAVRNFSCGNIPMRSRSSTTRGTACKPAGRRTHER